MCNHSAHGHVCSYATQLNAEKNKDRVLADVHQMCEAMRRTEGFGDGRSTKHFSEGDCAELVEATHSVFEGRRVVKFTFVREFLLEKGIYQLEEQIQSTKAELSESGLLAGLEAQFEELQQDREKFKLWQVCTPASVTLVYSVCAATWTSCAVLLGRIHS